MSAWATITNMLHKNGVENARAEARALIRAVTGEDPVLQDVTITDSLSEAAQKRMQHMPLSRIIGARDFMGQTYAVTQDVLDPRADSETLVNAVINAHKNISVVTDIGTGSGCLIGALMLHYPSAQGIAIDISAAALQVAHSNFVRHGIADRILCLHGDMRDITPPRRAQVLISNPPYIPTRDLAHLMPEVRDHDPVLALDGGTDGCDPYRWLFGRMGDFLMPDGHFYVEIGFDICDKVMDIARGAGLVDLTTIPDLAGIRRVITGRLPSDKKQN